MSKALSGLIISQQEKPLSEIRESSLEGVELTWSYIQPDADSQKIEGLLKDHAFSLVDGDYCLKLDKIVKHRSVSSHFLSYMDLVTLEGGKLWGHSIFSKVFLEVLLDAIKNQDFKGSVIFLGKNPLVYPTIEVLARFGFEDFVFLNVSDKKEILEIDKLRSGLLNTKVSQVDSAAFIQSQKEYSFCFVMENNYSQQVLEDMSYFHFLSGQSMVFDLAGQSNFLFKEVKALGVTVSEYSRIVEIRQRLILEAIAKVASNIS